MSLSYRDKKQEWHFLGAGGVKGRAGRGREHTALVFNQEETDQEPTLQSHCHNTHSESLLQEWRRSGESSRDGVSLDS